MNARLLARLLTPLRVRQIARQMSAEYPGLPPHEIGDKMRAALGRAPSFEEWRLIQAVVSRIRKKADAATAPRTPISAWVLVAANAVPLLGVLFWGWDVFTLLLIFCMENVIIGVLNLARMLCVDTADLRLWLAKLVMLPFFCIHYGGFAVGHGAIVFKVFGNMDNAQSILAWLLRAAHDSGMLLVVGVLAASHLFSFGWNYLYRGEFRGAKLSEVMVQPYARVMVMQVALLGGGFAADFFGAPLLTLVLLVVLKTWLDFTAHVKEHSLK